MHSIDINKLIFSQKICSKNHSNDHILKITAFNYIKYFILIISKNLYNVIIH